MTGGREYLRLIVCESDATDDRRRDSALVFRLSFVGSFMRSQSLGSEC